MTRDEERVLQISYHIKLRLAARLPSDPAGRLLSPTPLTARFVPGSGPMFLFETASLSCYSLLVCFSLTKYCIGPIIRFVVID